MKQPSIRLALCSLVVAGAPLLGGVPAYAGDDGVERNGSCSGRSDWELQAKARDGGLEVEAEVDSNRRGQRWKWVLRHNGDVVDRGVSRTRPPSGSFEVERRTNNADGTDTFRFRATHKGEVCRGRLRI
ncbi:hypothetical protein HNR19_000203 [Nocardioides thalensis]|uniref:Uncharacterized protein n=1 Tax=Nocardioides thalensis TaxID=1914755 RepID=A0A853BWN7_9ACTN|nr:hypothetical protein [Nocardioides thalensis]NYI99504.1 hypothetical protein [Nocardioides thalensis]